MTTADYWLPQPGRPKIKLLDERGRTVCVFGWYKHTQGALAPWATGEECWIPENKPQRDKQRRRMLQSDNKYRPGHQTPSPMQSSPDGRYYLVLPGLTLRWEKVGPILDRLAERNEKRLTIAQLRQYAS
ncbi:hypothetical protein A9W99_14480 [Mycobacterium sp. 1164966.3]|uniref:hypothetical protein n=1 Tax=Mycobacterium sp. 1164966.3 TaxID=1856861 RepID=UPI0007FF3BCA|nr:hypothetical protein [Mycobacterium sp. 1164966.3]OBA81239.1 hypothetical protein A9W99_14480 [Mycobacterium sp. 1164966.3]